MKIAVIGAGPAGCAAAYTLSKHSHQITVFEASDAIGGRTKQTQIGDFSVGVGALFLMGGIYPRTTALLEEIGKTDELIPWKGSTELRDSNNDRYPVEFVNLFSYLSIPKLTLGDRIKIAWAGLKLLLSPGAKNPFDGEDLAQYDNGDNLERWSRKNLGDRGYEYIIRPLFDFLYAVPPSWLSTPFPIAIIQQAMKMKLSVPPKGPVQVSEWLIEASRNTEIKLNCPVTKIEKQGDGYLIHHTESAEKFDRVVLATEAYTAATLMKEILSADFIAQLDAAPYTDYAHVQVGYQQNPWSNPTADIVLPVGYGEPPRSVGAMVLQSRRQPSSVPAGGEMVGVYFTTPPLETMSDEEIKAEALRWIHKTYGNPGVEPTFVKLFHYNKGLNIAKPGAYQYLEQLRRQTPDGIQLAGDYFAQAGIEAAVFSGERAAHSLMSS